MKVATTNELTVTQAANVLNMKLPGKDWAYWRSFLANNRKRGRATTYRIPFRRVRRTVFYKLEDLSEFASAEKLRRASRDPAGEPKPPKGGGANRMFKWAVDDRQSAEGSGDVVRLKVSGITVALLLTPSEARDLASQLNRHADRFST